MKKVLLVVGMLVATATLVSSGIIGNAAFSWSATTLSTGQIPQGTPHEVTFTFTNEGDAPLIISRTQGSCGCTATEYTQDAIAPGAEGWVKATYNAANVGRFSKTVTVYSNVPGQAVVLRLQGEVVAGE